MNYPVREKELLAVVLARGATNNMQSFYYWIGRTSEVSYIACMTIIIVIMFGIILRLLLTYSVRTEYSTSTQY